MKLADKIQVELMSWITASTTDFTIPNYYLGSFEADLLKVTKSLMLVEYEIKISKSDFKNDFNKKTNYYSKPNKLKHDLVKEGERVNRFYFVCPNRLLLPEEIPKELGLIWYEEGRGFKVVKQSKLLSKTPKVDIKQLRHMACNLHFKLLNAKRQLRELKQ